MLSLILNSPIYERSFLRNLFAHLKRAVCQFPYPVIVHAADRSGDTEGMRALPIGSFRLHAIHLTPVSFSSLSRAYPSP